MRNNTPTPNALGVSKYLIFELSRTNLKKSFIPWIYVKKSGGCPLTH